MRHRHGVRRRCRGAGDRRHAAANVPEHPSFRGDRATVDPCADRAPGTPCRVRCAEAPSRVGRARPAAARRHRRGPSGRLGTIRRTRRTRRHAPPFAARRRNRGDPSSVVAGRLGLPRRRGAAAPRVRPGAGRDASLPSPAGGVAGEQGLGCAGRVTRRGGDAPPASPRAVLLSAGRRACPGAERPGDQARHADVDVEPLPVDYRHRAFPLLGEPGSQGRASVAVASRSDQTKGSQRRRRPRPRARLCTTPAPFANVAFDRAAIDRRQSRQIAAGIARSPLMRLCEAWRSEVLPLCAEWRVCRQRAESSISAHRRKPPSL